MIRVGQLAVGWEEVCADAPVRQGLAIARGRPEHVCGGPCERLFGDRDRVVDDRCASRGNHTEFASGREVAHNIIHRLWGSGSRSETMHPAIGQTMATGSARKGSASVRFSGKKRTDADSPGLLHQGSRDISGSIRESGSDVLLDVQTLSGRIQLVFSTSGLHNPSAFATYIICCSMSCMKMRISLTSSAH